MDELEYSKIGATRIKACKALMLEWKKVDDTIFVARLDDLTVGTVVVKEGKYFVTMANVSNEKFVCKTNRLANICIRNQCVEFLLKHITPIIESILEDKIQLNK